MELLLNPLNDSLHNEWLPKTQLTNNIHAWATFKANGLQSIKDSHASQADHTIGTHKKNLSRALCHLYANLLP